METTKESEEEEEEENIYIIDSNIDNYNYILDFLNKDNIKIINKMINVDGSYDFVILCTNRYSQFLKEKEIHIIKDEKIVFVINKIIF